MKTYITYFDDNQISEYNLRGNTDTVLFKGNDTTMSGDSINELNTYYCELTTLYWVWKNTDDEILCFKQYRRPFESNITPEEGQIVTYKPIFMRDPVEGQYIICHGKKRNNDVIKVLIDLYGKTSPYVRYWRYCNEMYTNNTMIIHRKDFNKMCEFVFDTLFALDKLWKLNKDPGNYEKNVRQFVEDGRYDYQCHFMAYIGERLVSAYIKMNLNTIQIERPVGDGFYMPYKAHSQKERN